jgi:hypothetical protein
MTNRRTRAGLLMALALAAVACSDDPELADITTVAPPVTVDTTAAPTTEPAPATTEVPDTTVADTAPATSAPVATDAGTGTTGPMFSDALGVPVDSAPGVNTPGDTRQLLPDGLYVHIAWAADPNDPSVYTVQPEDVEILEAYANAVRTYYQAALTTLTTDDPDFDRYYLDDGAKYEDSFAQARDGGYTATLGNGVVLRPYIPADQRTSTSAVVLDCYLQNEQFIRAGETADLKELTPVGQVATMALVDGAWLIDIASEEPAACL